MNRSVRVIDLSPGDRVTSLGVDGDVHATFLVQSKHPLYPGLQLVIWWVHEEARWSFDALSPIQQVGVLDSPLGMFTHQQRQDNLRNVLHGTEAVPS